MRMKRVIILLAPFMLACLVSSLVIRKPTSTQEEKLRSTITIARPTAYQTCRGDICIRNLYAWMNKNILWLQLDLVDIYGKVQFGNEPVMKGDIKVSVYQVKKDLQNYDEQYLFGGNFPEGAYSCYRGNDLVWNAGYLGSVCTIPFPVVRMQRNPAVGDFLKIDLPEFNRTEIVLIHTLYTNKLLSEVPILVLPTESASIEPTLSPPGLSETPTSNPLDITSTVGSDSFPHLIGETVQLSDHVIRLEQAIFATDMVTVTFLMENNGLQDIYVSPALNFFAVLDDNTSLDIELTRCSELLDGQVPAGETIEGNVCWRGPFVGSLTITYMPQGVNDTAVNWIINSP
jgi:hypothetical protein